jgi:hypothetical protein
MATIQTKSGAKFTVPDAVVGDYLERGFTRPGVPATPARRGRSAPRAAADAAEREPDEAEQPPEE